MFGIRIYLKKLILSFSKVVLNVYNVKVKTFKKDFDFEYAVLNFY